MPVHMNTENTLAHITPFQNSGPGLGFGGGAPGRYLGPSPALMCIL